jgi:hypothetical protein
VLLFLVGEMLDDVAAGGGRASIQCAAEAH